MSINFVPVEVVKPDPHWPVVFQSAADEISAALQSIAVRIDHVGSTAVPGLAAKPTVDIQVSVEDLDLSPYRTRLEALRYTFHERSLGEAEHRFFSSPGRLIHLHVCPAGSAWQRSHLLLRDFLRAHPEVAFEYGALKRRLAAQYRLDRVGYSESKEPFIEAHMEQADQWAAATGWQLPAADVDEGPKGEP